jgi:hypothetical protein
VTDIVVAAPLGGAGHEREDRLRPIQRLDLALLVHAHHHSPLRRIEIQPAHVVQLVDEQWIARQLEALRPPRLPTNAFQIRTMAVWDIPAAWAMERLDQCVAPTGLSSNVLTTTFST